MVTLVNVCASRASWYGSMAVWTKGTTQGINLQVGPSSLSFNKKRTWIDLLYQYS